jgi:tRNA-2-methylthio-N6-dimethylallyladenosine synthase
MKTARRFFVETWGCQMNELDSQRLTGQLMQEGLLPTRDPSEADLILLNSCSVREKAEQKVYSRLGEYRAFKQGRDDLRIGLCGCVAQEAGERALRRVPDLDFVLGPARVGEIGSILPRVRNGERVVATGFPEQWSYDFDAVARDGTHKGMVTIIEGCNKSCTFCIVPMTRGPERCRSMQQILQEVRHLVEYGFLEIELLGQTVNHWKDPAAPLDFADLLDAVAQIAGVERLRFVTSYPRDFTPRMVEQFARHPNICPYLHLPVQSGADSVLRRMGRGYTIAEYADLVSSLRVARPDIALSTDVIVGFPGETDEEFEATMRLVEKTSFSSIFAFKYSPRPGTAAPKLGPPIEEEVANDRLQMLLGRQQEIQHELNRALEGSVREVLITGLGRKPGTLSGRTACHRIVHFPIDGTESRVGSLAEVRIERALPHSLLGRFVPVTVA